MNLIGWQLCSLHNRLPWFFCLVPRCEVANQRGALIWLAVLRVPSLSCYVDNSAFLLSASYPQVNPSNIACRANCPDPFKIAGGQAHKWKRINTRDLRGGFLTSTRETSLTISELPKLYKYIQLWVSIPSTLPAASMDSFLTLAAFSSAPVSSEETQVQVPVDQERYGNANCYCVIAWSAPHRYVSFLPSVRSTTESVVRASFWSLQFIFRSRAIITVHHHSLSCAGHPIGLRSRHSPHSVTVDRNCVLCYLWFRWIVVLTSGMPRLLGVTTLELRTFAYHRFGYTFLNFLLYVLEL